MGGRREVKLVTRLWERLFLVSGLSQRHSQEHEPGQEKGNDCDPAELVCGAGKGTGGLDSPGWDGGRREETHVSLVAW